MAINQKIGAVSKTQQSIIDQQNTQLKKKNISATPVKTIAKSNNQAYQKNPDGSTYFDTRIGIEKPTEKVKALGNQSYQKNPDGTMLFDQRDSTTKIPTGPATQPTTPAQSEPVIAPKVDPTTATIPGIDIEALKASGATQETIDKIVSMATPKLEAEQNKLADQQFGLKFQQESLNEEEKLISDTYKGIKQEKENLAVQKESIINESANVEKAALEQAKAKEEHIIAQEQARYDLDRSKEESRIQEENLKNEEQSSRAMASQLGLAFGSYGIQKITQIRQEGSRILADARAETSIGKAEFSFRLQDIERNYVNSTNRVEQGRRDLQIQNLSALSEQLQAIDEKKLISLQEKKQQSRDLIKDYLEKKETIDDNVANILSKTAEETYAEIDKLKKEKRETETVDLDMSKTLGFYANKWGEPINENADGSPKIFNGDYDEKLSAVMGHLVDNRGRAILDDKGQKIIYTPASKQLYDDAIKAYYEGKSTNYQNSLLNTKIGTNNYIKTAVKAGSYGGQCGTFIRTKFTTEGSWETECAGLEGPAMNSCSLKSKRNMVDKRGFRRGAGTPSVGDVVIFDGKNYGAVGHYAMINEIDPATGEAILTESNYVSKNTVSTNRRISLNDAQIYGFFTPNHKDAVTQAQPVLTAPGADGSEGGGQTSSSAGFRGLLDILSNEKATEAQLTKAGFAYNALEAEKAFKKYKNEGVDASDLKTSASEIMATGKANLVENIVGVKVLPMENIIANLKTPREKDIVATRLNWIKNVLRPESGAAIGLEEYQQFERIYFPPANSSKIEQENANVRRQQAIQGLLIGTGRLGSKILDYTESTNTPYQVAEDDTSQIDKDIKQGTDIVTGAFNTLGQQATGAINQGQQAASQAIDTGKEYFGRTNEDVKKVIDSLRDQFSPEDLQSFLNENGY